MPRPRERRTGGREMTSTAHRNRTAVLALAVGLAAAMQATPAPAASVRMNGSTLQFTDVAAEANNVQTSGAGTTDIRVVDVVRMTVGAGCVGENAGNTSVRCSDVNSMILDAGSGADRVTSNG